MKVTGGKYARRCGIVLRVTQMQLKIRFDDGEEHHVWKRNVSEERHRGGVSPQPVSQSVSNIRETVQENEEFELALLIVCNRLRKMGIHSNDPELVDVLRERLDHH